MRAFIVTASQARKLPRWGLLLLCVLYVVPGFVGRDPWRTEDAVGFGIANTMLGGEAADWLMPNIAGSAVYEYGPLPFALSAALAYVLQILSQAFNWAVSHTAWEFAITVTPHLSVRIAAAIGLAMMLAFMWHATYMLTRRPGVLPSDPIGASASRTDFARALADSGLLIILAMIGLIARMHETTAMAAQVTWIAMFIYGLAKSLDYPERGALIAGLAIAASVATRGLPVSIAMTLAWLLLPVLSQPFRLVWSSTWRIGLPVAVVGALLWPLALWLRGSDVALAHLATWLQWNLTSLGAPDEASLRYAGRYFAWFYWPAWPLALWAMYRWRGSLGQPVIALPLTVAATQLLVSLMARDPGEEWLLPAALPLALMACVGLSTLKRAVVNLIDWFAVMFFSLFGFAIWAYWLAYLTGWPERMAFSVERLIPGFLPQWTALDLALALMASAAWIVLVQWRISRRPSVIWRAVVLSSGGLCLAWFLLMTLWLPVFNERNTYKNVAMNIARHVPDKTSCVQARNLDLAARASFAYFGELRFAREDESCQYLLIQDYGKRASNPVGAEPGWRLRWEGRRRANRKERFRFYRLDQ